MALILIFAALFLASALSFVLPKDMRFAGASAIVLAALKISSALYIVSAVVARGSYGWHGYFLVDPLGAVFVLMLSFVGSAVTTYSVGYLKEEMKKGIIGFRRVRQYFGLLHLFLLAMFFAVTTTSPILAWVAIEATTLSTAFLISFYGKASSLEAAWKYLMVNSVGLLCGLFGTLLFLYPAIHGGTGSFVSWASLLSQAPNFDPFILKIAFVFVLVGYGTKVGFVPMHTWLPDAHSKAPAPISALLSGVLLNVAFFAVLRYLGIADAVLGTAFPHNLLIFFGLISIVFAALLILAQRNYKRLLAYSSIEHMGIAALGFGFGGVASVVALLHMFYHSLTKSLLFLSAGNIFLKFSSTKIRRVKGTLAVLPVTGILFIVGFLAITGMPPFGTFLTELSILSAGIRSHAAITVLVILALALAFIGFLKHVVSMVFGETEEPLPKGEANIWTLVPVLALAVVLILLSAYIPSGMQVLLSSASSL